MTNIVFLVNQLRNVGPVRVILDIVRHLDRTRFNPIIFSLRPDSIQLPIADKFEQIGAEIIRMRFTMLELELCSSRIAKLIENRIRQSYINVIIHAHGYHPTIIANHIDLPKCTTVHCISKEDYISSKGFLMGSYMVCRFGRNLSKYKYPVVISRYMQQFYSSITNGHERIIHNGVNIDYTDIGSKWRITFKRSIGITSEEKLIVVTGVLSKGKNNIFIINELQRCNMQNVKVVFLGTGPQMEKLRKLTENDIRFQFEGFKTNIHDYLNAADLYLSASLSEGLPLAVLEAVVSGCPTLLSAIPPHIEIAETINMNAVGTYKLKEGELSSKLNTILNSNFNRSEISANAMKYFSAKSMSDKYQKLYSEIILNFKSN